MKKKSTSLIISIVFLYCFVSLIFISSNKSYSATKPKIYAGTAKVNITPKVPIPMSGYGGRNEPFKGVHDDLFARAIVFSDGVNKSAIISAELIGFSNSYWEETTKQIEQETGIKQDYVFLLAVHNHNGPTTRVYGESNAPEVVAYVNELKEKLVSIVKEANGNLKPSSIGVGKGECKMNINRRANDAKGGIALGQNPYGPCDHEVIAVRIDGEDGNPVAMLVNWPCHGVVLGPRNYLITGDWPGAASTFIESKLDNKALALMIIGASGDINPIYGPHIDFVDNNAYAYGKDAIGIILGEEVIRITKDIKTSPYGPINAVQRVINLPEKEGKKPKSLQPDYKPGEGVKVRLSAIKVGNIIFAGVSGEVFNQIGVKIKEKSPYNYTLVITHCNGSSGYLVTDDAYAEGGYEVNSTRVKSGAEKGIIDNLLEMINEL
jgi:hypothetical protein